MLSMVNDNNFFHPGNQIVLILYAKLRFSTMQVSYW